jgi:uncharacterized protein (TIRG00374 family)
MKSRLIILLLLILTLGIIILRSDINKVWKYLLEVRWDWVFIVILINFFITFLEVIRWKLIISPIKKIGIMELLTAFLIGVVGNIFMPLRIGDGIRAYYLSKKDNIKLTSSLSTVMADYFLNAVYFVVFIIIVFFAFPIPIHVQHLRFLIVALIITGLFFLFIQLPFSKEIKNKIKKILGNKISEKISLFRTGLSAFRNVNVIINTSIISIVIWGLKTAMIWSMIKAFHLQLHIMASAVVVIISNISIALINTPANIGGFELSTVGALKIFDVDIEQAISYAILLHLVEVIPIIIFSFLLFGYKGLSFKKILLNKSFSNIQNVSPDYGKDNENFIK